jgi:hypothetical protein
LPAKPAPATGMNICRARFMCEYIRLALKASLGSKLMLARTALVVSLGRRRL